MMLSRNLEFVAGLLILVATNHFWCRISRQKDADFADERLVKEFASSPWARLSQIRSAQAACHSAPRIQASFLGGRSITTPSSRHALANKMYAVTPSAAGHGKKENRAVPTPDWRVFAGGDLGSTLVVGSVVAVDTVFELMRVSRTCSHGKLSEGLANKFCGLPWTVCVDRRDNQRQK